jgi:hypothetical protein
MWPEKLKRREEGVNEKEFHQKGLRRREQGGLFTEGLGVG